MSEQNQTPRNSLGMARVRVDFNPGGNPLVNRIKMKAAELIDLCDQYNSQVHDDPEVSRCYEIAIQQFEDGAMWAVKAATAGK